MGSESVLEFKSVKVVSGNWLRDVFLYKKLVDEKYYPPTQIVGDPPLKDIIEGLNQSLNSALPALKEMIGSANLPQQLKRMKRTRKRIATYPATNNHEVSQGCLSEETWFLVGFYFYYNLLVESPSILVK
jgi:hypothetical protein